MSPRLLAVVCLSACGGGTTRPRDGPSTDAGLPADARGPTPDAARVLDADPDALVKPTACATSYSPPETVALLAEPALVETSGMVASRAHVDTLWLHNDSGDGPLLYRTGTDGAALGTVTLTGIDAVDFEDIATGPCPDDSGPCLFIADTGNNLLDREELMVYVIPEPRTDQSEVPVRWRFPLRYPTENLDVEALVVPPEGGRFYLIEKADAAIARVFVHPGPLEDGVSVVLDELTSFASPGVPIRFGLMITGADLHPSGARLLIRTYTGSWEYRLAADQTLADLDAIVPIRIALGPLDEPQGEAIAYDQAGMGIWTVSEGLTPVELHYYACAD